MSTERNLPDFEDAAAVDAWLAALPDDVTIPAPSVESGLSFDGTDMAAFEAWIDGLDFADGSTHSARIVTGKGTYYVEVMPKKLGGKPIRFDHEEAAE